LARPPSTDVNETFLREVDEEYRRDKVRDFFVENRAFLISAIVLFLAAAGGWIWWQNHQREQAGKQVEELAAVFQEIGKGNGKQVEPRLKALEESSSEAVRTTVLFTGAALDLENNNPKAAAAKYRSIAEDEDQPEPYRQIALIRQTALEFDQLKPEEVIARMKPLATPGEPWFGSAGEMTALALIKQGKTAEAGKLFAAIGRDKSVPEVIRGRAVQMASSLGIDASDLLNERAQ
jgi:hypothetical protein